MVTVFIIMRKDTVSPGCWPVKRFLNLLFSFIMNRKQLSDKLSFIRREYKKNNKKIRRDQDTFLLWCEKQVKTKFSDSFIEGKVNQATNHLALFLLGDKDNNFDRLINPNTF